MPIKLERKIHRVASGDEFALYKAASDSTPGTFHYFGFFVPEGSETAELFCSCRGQQFQHKCWHCDMLVEQVSTGAWYYDYKST